MPGPPKTPTALNVLRGNPSHRPVNKLEPQLEIQAPECPGHIQNDVVAKAEWDRVVPILLRMRVLTVADQQALAMLCMIHSQMLKAADDLRKYGSITKRVRYLRDKKRELVLEPNPAFDQIAKCEKMLQRGWANFGLTPAGRVRLQIIPDVKPTNKWADVG